MASIPLQEIVIKAISVLRVSLDLEGVLLIISIIRKTEGGTEGTDEMTKVHPMAADSLVGVVEDSHGTSVSSEPVILKIITSDGRTVTRRETVD